MGPKTNIYTEIFPQEDNFEGKLAEADYSILKKLLEESTTSLPRKILESENKVLNQLIVHEKHGEIMESIGLSVTMSLLAQLLESLFDDLELPVIVDDLAGKRTKSTYRVHQVLRVFNELIVFNHF